MRRNTASTELPSYFMDQNFLWFSNPNIRKVTITFCFPLISIFLWAHWSGDVPRSYIQPHFLPEHLALYCWSEGGCSAPATVPGKSCYHNPQTVSQILWYFFMYVLNYFSNICDYPHFDWSNFRTFSMISQWPFVWFPWLYEYRISMLKRKYSKIQTWYLFWSAVE